MCYFGTCNEFLCFCDDFFSNFDFSEKIFWPWRIFVTNFCRSMLKVCFTNYRLEIKCSFKNYFNALDLSINAFVSSIFDSIEVKEDFFFLDGCSSKTFCGKVDLSFVHSMYKNVLIKVWYTILHSTPKEYTACWARYSKGI